MSIISEILFLLGGVMVNVNHTWDPISPRGVMVNVYHTWDPISPRGVMVNVNHTWDPISHRESWSMYIIPEILFLLGCHGQCISYRRSHFSLGVMVNVYHSRSYFSSGIMVNVYHTRDPISPRGSWSMYIIPEILFLLGGHGQCQSYLRSYFSSGVMVNIYHTWDPISPPLSSSASCSVAAKIFCNNWTCSSLVP